MNGISKGLALSLLAKKAPAINSYAVVTTGAELSAAITDGKKVIELTPGGTYTVTNQPLTSGTRIQGNGATLSPINSDSSVVNIFAAHDVRIEDVIFKGQASSANNAAYDKNHFGINVARSFRTTVRNCQFIDFTGGGIGGVGAAADDYKEYGALIEGNEFQRCFFTLIATGRWEFGRYIGNRANNCRAHWMEAGNWTEVGNKHTSCRTPWLLTNRAVDYTANGINAFVANSGHGTLAAFEANHSSDEGASAWSSNNGIPLIGGTTYNPAGGIVVDGVLPPRMTGLTMYYVNLSVLNLPATDDPMRITSITTRNVTISADVPGVLELVGHTSETATTLTNVVSIDEAFASATQLGKVKVGSGLAIDANGVLSATASGRTTMNISVSIDEYGYNSQLGDGLPATQGWVTAGTNAAVTDPAAANFAGLVVGTDGGIQTLIAKDSSSTHNPNFTKVITNAQKKSLYANGGTVKLRWKPYTVAAGAAGLLGIYFPEEAAWTGWTGLNTRAHVIINPTFSAISGNLATVNWNWNGAALNQTNFDMSIYHDIELRIFPAQNKVQFWVDGAQVGGDQAWSSATNYGASGTVFADKLIWASGSTGGTTIGMWIRAMSAFINGNTGSMTTPLSDVDTAFNVPSDWRNYTLSISDQAYAKYATIKGTVNLPAGFSLTVSRANNNVLINGVGSNIVINGNGTKQTVSFTQQVGNTGKQWVQD